MWTLVVITMVVWGVDAKGIKLHLSDEMKSMLEKSDWDHQDTTLSIHGPMTLDIQSSFKLKEGQEFIADTRTVHIYPTPTTKKTVFCDMTTNGGGWTVIQRRIDGKTNFFRNWKDYKNGFGHADHEYWLGNDAIHELTKDKKQILRIDLMKFSREKGHAMYSSFFVDNESKKYKLKLGSFNGTKGLGDSLGRVSNNMYFSTMDNDNDKQKGNCAKDYKTAGWFNNCFYTNLNGWIRKDSRNDATELCWYDWGPRWSSLKSAKMMIRPM